MDEKPVGSMSRISSKWGGGNETPVKGDEPTCFAWCAGFSLFQTKERDLELRRH